MCSISNKNIKTKGVYNSRIYHIHDIQNNKVALRNEKDGEPLMSSKNEVLYFNLNDFDPAYCITCYRYQGSTIEEEYNIHEATFDNGNEFKGDVKKLLNEKGAEIHLNDPKSLNSKNTMGLIERFNKTVLNKMRKFMTANDTVQYVDAIPDIIDNYNNTVHSATNRTPYSILKGKQVPLIELHDTDLVKDDYKIGSYVRFSEKKQNLR